MPHSSGGGSSGGGSFGGSSSHGYSGGGSGGSSGRFAKSGRYYRSYHPGSDAYVSYDDGKPEYRYWNHNDVNTNVWWVTMIPIIIFQVILVGMMIVGLYLLAFLIIPPKPVTEVNSHVHWTEVEDTVDCFTDSEEEAITQQLHELYEKSGIITKVETVDSETVAAETSYDSLEIYAYTRYLTDFPSENCWLIVFETKPDGEWEFHGMQGDNTDSVLSEKKTEKFNYNLTQYLWDTDNYTYGSAFAAALDTFNDTVMYPPSISHVDLATGTCLVILSALFQLFITAPVFRNWRLSREVRSGKFHRLHNPQFVSSGKTKVPVLMICPYCHGLFASGEYTCPHCGAPATDAKPAPNQTSS